MLTNPFLHKLLSNEFFKYFVNWNIAEKKLFSKIRIINEGLNFPLLKVFKGIKSNNICVYIYLIL